MPPPPAPALPPTSFFLPLPALHFGDQCPPILGDLLLPPVHLRRVAAEAVRLVQELALRHARRWRRRQRWRRRRHLRRGLRACGCGDENERPNLRHCIILRFARNSFASRLRAILIDPRA